MATNSSLLEYKIQIEQQLSVYITPPEGPFRYIFEAARYSLLNPGKRIRPLLVMTTAESLGSAPHKALTPACAIEMLHTYSLIHDDLPCMDDDDLRRGKPTLHTIYPEGQAVLAGDLLLTLAFETLANSPDLTNAQIVSMTKVLARHSGGLGMIGGQSLDLLSEHQTISWSILEQIHLGKTSALLSAALEMGAIIACASIEYQKKLHHLGQIMGLSFQIIDDILDVEGNKELIGKPLHSDQNKDKATSITVLGLDKAKELSQTLLEEALELCHQMHLTNSSLAQLLPNLVHRRF